CSHLVLLLRHVLCILFTGCFLFLRCCTPFLSFVLFFLRHHPPPVLDSFPTRRSSDLDPQRVPGCLPERRSDQYPGFEGDRVEVRDRKSTRLNSSHASISYAVFCLYKKMTHVLPLFFWHH